MNGWPYLWLIAGVLLALLALAGIAWPFGLWIVITLAVFLLWAWESYRFYNS